MFASGSDDTRVKLWSVRDPYSIATIEAKVRNMFLPTIQRNSFLTNYTAKKASISHKSKQHHQNQTYINIERNYQFSEIRKTFLHRISSTAIEWWVGLFRTSEKYEELRAEEVSRRQRVRIRKRDKIGQRTVVPKTEFRNWGSEIFPMQSHQFFIGVINHIQHFWNLNYYLGKCVLCLFLSNSN